MGGCWYIPQQSFILQIDDFKATHHERLDWISPQLIWAKKLLQDICEPRHQCLEELALQKELVNWLYKELGGVWGSSALDVCQVGFLNLRTSCLNHMCVFSGG